MHDKGIQPLTLVPYDKSGAVDLDRFEKWLRKLLKVVGSNPRRDLFGFSVFRVLSFLPIVLQLILGLFSFTVRFDLF